MSTAPTLSVGDLQVVHEGRGGHIAIGVHRYAIEHIEGGCFAIHFPGGQRHARLTAHRNLIEALVKSDPAKWHLPASAGKPHKS